MFHRYVRLPEGIPFKKSPICRCIAQRGVDIDKSLESSWTQLRFETRRKESWDLFMRNHHVLWRVTIEIPG